MGWARCGLGLIRARWRDGRLVALDLLDEDDPSAPAGVADAPAGVLGDLARAVDGGPLPETWVVDPDGTALQRAVWAAARDIPAGQTRSYSQLAAAVGRPDAVRAVAAALGANPVAVLIPCHRVVGARGELRGYRWGLWRKELLLRREGAAGPLWAGLSDAARAGPAAGPATEDTTPPAPRSDARR